MRRKLFSYFLLLIFFTQLNVFPGEGNYLSRKILGSPDKTYRLNVSAYCSCKKCTGWKRNWFFRPVYAYGKSRGKKKEVGLTFDGTKVRKGIIAADFRQFPLGTVMDIPGYGLGVVHDKGGDINGMRVDIYFDTHKEALKWGRQFIDVAVWFPKKHNK